MDFHQFFLKIKAFFREIDGIQRNKATDILAWEAEEMENIFALLVLGTFIGLPTPPVHLVMALLPEMEREFGLMIDKVAVAHDPLGELFSVLDIC
ncbi:hypothetical protein DENIS_4352 [Desulfonema ishimotonii]|uniref:Uncharacterized protein n=1 Tax=Desulfonema ishimotonii TaxID=45657 RepID=A0A401G294_9BACT|nr:hypothetical protein [Desulfonema ishimotonii]GBC63358.1 hypothetical protein DENIS_4352 [Desulfonema ishimotonii]